MAVINLPVGVITQYDSLGIEFTTDADAISRVNYSYTDPYGVVRTGVSAKTGPITEHAYVLTGIPRNTAVTYTITATFSGGVTDVVGPAAATTRNPKLFANIRTKTVVVPGTEIDLRALHADLFEVPRMSYLQITVSANTQIRFELSQTTQVLLPNLLYTFFAVGNVYLTGASTANLAFMQNPNF